MSVTVERINALVEETQLTVRELASAAGCSKSAMQRYLAGERDIPMPVIASLARVLCVNPAYLANWTDDRNFSPKKQLAAESDELSMTKQELSDIISNLSENEAAVYLAALKSTLGKS